MVGGRVVRSDTDGHYASNLDPNRLCRGDVVGLLGLRLCVVYQNVSIELSRGGWLGARLGVLNEANRLYFCYTLFSVVGIRQSL